MDQGSPEWTSSLELLAQAIVQNRAMVFIGTGASMSTGVGDSIPDWNELIRLLSEKAKANFLSGDTHGREYLDRLLTEGDYLAAADLIHDILDNELSGQLFEVFDRPDECPTDIQRAIARIPFNIFVTTNYDRQIEKAHGSKITVLTAQDADALLLAAVDVVPIILKTHGAIGNGPSIVLGGREYVWQMYANQRFRQVLKWIFATRTCIFVGTSLKDPDLLHIFREAIAEFSRKSFGLHYAILPAWEAPKARVDYLAKSLRIRVLSLGEWNGPKRLENYSNQLRQQLTRLSGEVARQRLNLSPPRLAVSDEPQFSLRTAFKDLLRHAVAITGSFRGDICLTIDPLGSSANNDLAWWDSEGPSDISIADLQPKPPNWENPQQSRKPPEVEPWSVIGIAFHTAETSSGVYVRDTVLPKIDEGTGQKHYGPVNYKLGHTDVRSEFAIPIQSDGIRVGVLNLESNLANAYGEGHREVARWFASRAGRLYGAALQRNQAGQLLQWRNDADEEASLGANRDRVAALIQSCYQHSAVGASSEFAMDFLLFVANYRNGTLEAFRPSPKSAPKEREGTGEQLVWPLTIYFEESARLAAQVFGKQIGIVYRDTAWLLETAKLHPGTPETLQNTLEQLHVKGPIGGFPIRINRQLAGVMVIWSLTPSLISVNGLWNCLRVSEAALDLAYNRLLGAESNLKKRLELSEEVINIFRSADRCGISADGIAGVGPHPLVNWDDQDDQFEFNTQWAVSTASLLQKFLALINTEFGEEVGATPTQARLWIATECARKGDAAARQKTPYPTFALAYQIRRISPLEWKGQKRFLDPDSARSAISKCSPDRARMILLTTPLPTSEERKDGGFSPNAMGNTRKGVGGAADRGWFWEPSNCTPNVVAKGSQAVLFPDNPNLSRLLSRAGVDASTRMQKPFNGTDPMHTWLDKKTEESWFISPIMVSVCGRGGEPANGVRSDDIKPVAAPPLRCAGFLVYDRASDQSASQPQHVDDKRVDELKRTMDLFAVLLAQDSAFDSFHSGAQKAVRLLESDKEIVALETETAPPGSVEDGVSRMSDVTKTPTAAISNPIDSELRVKR